MVTLCSLKHMMVTCAKHKVVACSHTRKWTRVRGPLLEETPRLYSCTMQKVHTGPKWGQIPVSKWLLYPFLGQGPVPEQMILVCEWAITEIVVTRMVHFSLPHRVFALQVSKSVHWIYRWVIIGNSRSFRFPVILRGYQFAMLFC